MRRLRAVPPATLASLATLSTLAALAALVALAGLAGCAKPKPPEAIPDATDATVAYEAQWVRYHWYYPEISHTLRVRWSTTGQYSGTLAHVVLRMTAKALTQEGAADVGVLHLEGWNTAVIKLDVVHLDSTGTRVPVPMQAVRAGFRDKGLVVVPRVAKGSTVSVVLTRGPFSSIDAWELPMDRNVPVLKSEIRLSVGKGIVFDASAYNGLEGPVLERNRRGRAPDRVWSARAVMPLADMPYADGMTARPRFLLTNRNNAYGTRLATWKGVARARQSRDFASGLFDLTGKTYKLARTLADSAGAADTTRARHLLTWVQDHITPVPEPTNGGMDGVLERRKGTEDQVVALFAAMCRAAGLPAGIAVSRRRERGGLDPEAANPDATETPLVLVTAGGREWAAFPQSPCFGLGDYPSGLAGMPALSLETGALRPLPQPAHGVSRVTVRQEASLEDPRARRAMVELEGPAAAQARGDSISALAGDPLAGCRASLGLLGFNAAIRKCTQSGLEEREHPFRLDLVLENSGSSVDEEGSRTWTIPNLFCRPAWFYDSTRTDDYFLPQDLVYRETTVFHAPGAQALRHDIPCRDVANDFLTVACRGEETADGPAFTREITLRRGRHPAATLKAMHAELADLDRIRGARLTVRR